MTLRYSAFQFAIFRIVFGLYLALNFALLVRHAPRLFSKDGMISNPSLNWTYGYFPDILYFVDNQMFVKMFLALLFFFSLSFAFGVARPVMALLIWYGEACLYNRNNYYWSPAMPLIGWLLLACAIIPSGEPLCALGSREQKSEWYMPKEILWGAWFILGLSYSVSGFYKCAGPSWMDGSAIGQSLRWVWARNWWYPQTLLASPPLVLKWITWTTLFLETFFLLLCTFRLGRIFAWCGMVLMHLNILLLLDLADLTSGVLLFHLFLFDPRWFGFGKKNAAVP